MEYFGMIFKVLMILFLVLGMGYNSHANPEISQTLIVDQSGKGNFTKVQQAIDSITPQNNTWVLIQINGGVYKEKVVVPVEKPYIIMRGVSGYKTIIQFDDAGDSLNSSTFQLYADHFIAKDISFKNTYNKILRRVNGKKITWAPAALVKGDMVSFYHCAFTSVQDTLTDFLGRHYYKDCYIEGAMDFIWGAAQSIYQKCNINVTSTLSGESLSHITAQGRETEADTSGFVFVNCIVLGTGPADLGRAYRKYSRVIFYKSILPEFISPEGWSAWDQVGQEQFITYVEFGCQGPGSDMTKRVKWMKKLDLKQLRYFTHAEKFLDKNSWMEPQPTLL